MSDPQRKDTPTSQQAAAMSPPSNPRPEPRAGDAPARSEHQGVQMNVVVLSGDGKDELSETTRLMNGKLTHEGEDPVLLTPGENYRLHLTLTYGRVRDKDYGHNFTFYRVKEDGKLALFEDYKKSAPGWGENRVFPADPLSCFTRQYQLYVNAFEPGAYKFVLRSWKVADYKEVVEKFSGEKRDAELQEIETHVVVDILASFTTSW